MRAWRGLGWFVSAFRDDCRALAGVARVAASAVSSCVRVAVMRLGGAGVDAPLCTGTIVVGGCASGARGDGQSDRARQLCRVTMADIDLALPRRRARRRPGSSSVRVVRGSRHPAGSHCASRLPRDDGRRRRRSEACRRAWWRAPRSSRPGRACARATPRPPPPACLASALFSASRSASSSSASACACMSRPAGTALIGHVLGSVRAPARSHRPRPRPPFCSIRSAYCVIQHRLDHALGRTAAEGLVLLDRVEHRLQHLADHHRPRTSRRRPRSWACPPDPARTSRSTTEAPGMIADVIGPTMSACSAPAALID